MPQEKRDLVQAAGQNCIVREIPPSEAWDLICSRNSGPAFGEECPADPRPLVILDVRTLEEYSSGHLEEAANVDFKSPSFREMLSSLDRGKAYLVYCRTGIRSGRAVVIMADLGFLEIYDLSGGISRWHQEGFKVTKQPESDE